MSNEITKAIEALQDIENAFVLVPIEVISEIEGALANITDRVSNGHGGAVLHAIPSDFEQTILFIEEMGGYKMAELPSIYEDIYEDLYDEV